MKKRMILFLVLFLGVILSGCSKKSSLERIQESKKLIVATNAEFPPFEYIEGNEFIGFDMDLARIIARELGVELEIKHMDFDAVIGSVASKKADIAIAGLTISPDRLDNVDFSKSYFNASQVVIVKKDNDTITGTDEESLVKTLEGKKIGFQAGTVGQFYVEGSSSWEFPGIKDAEAKTYANGALALTDLINDRIDAIIIDEMPAKVFINNNDAIKMISTPLTVEEYAIAIPKGETSLKEFIDSVLAKIIENGEFEQLTKKYFG